MSVDYSKLLLGQRISSQTCVLDAGTVSNYAEAVGDLTQLYSADDGRPLAPPMAIAALSLRGVVNDLEIPRGTLHAGQEMRFIAAVPVGERLDCTATLAQNSVRGEWRFMVVRLEVEDSKGRAVMDGKSTIMLPIQS